MTLREDEPGSLANSVVEILLRFLEPAFSGNPLLLLSNLRRFLLRLGARERDDHDRDGEHSEQRKKRQKGQRRQKHSRGLGLSAIGLAAAAAKGAFARHGFDIIIRARPFVRVRLCQPQSLHGD